jgi:hypothetical protein
MFINFERRNFNMYWIVEWCVGYDFP